MSYLQELQDYLAAYESFDQLFMREPRDGDPYGFKLAINFPGCLKSRMLAIFDFRTILLASMRGYIRNSLQSDYYRDPSKGEDLETLADKFLDILVCIERQAVDVVINCVKQLTLGFDVQGLYDFLINQERDDNYFKILNKEQLPFAETCHIQIDLLSMILHLRDTSLIRDLLNTVFPDAPVTDADLLHLVHQAMVLFNRESTDLDKRKLAILIDGYQRIVHDTLHFLSRMHHKIPSIHSGLSKAPEIYPFNTGKFFDKDPLKVSSAALEQFFKAYLKVHEMRDFGVSPLDLARELQIPDSIRILRAKRPIVMEDLFDRFEVYARQLARRHLKQSPESISLVIPPPGSDLPASNIFSRFLVIFGWLSRFGLTSSNDMISTLEGFEERERSALCECLISMLKDLVNISFTPSQDDPLTIPLELGEVRIPTPINVVRYAIRQLMSKCMQALVHTQDRMVALKYLFDCVKLSMTVADRGFECLQDTDFDLLAGFPEAERHELSRYATEAWLDRFRACNQAILRHGDCFVFSQRLIQLRSVVEGLEKLISALAEERPSIKDRQFEIHAISDLHPKDQREALACLQDEFDAGEITPEIEAQLRDLLQRLLIQRERLLSEIGIIKNIIDNIQKQCADRDLRSTLDCFRAFDEYVLSTTRLENLDLSQPVNLAPSHGVNFPPIVAFRTMLLVAMRQKIREHIEKNPAEHEACDALLSKVTAASLDQLLDVINGLTSDIAEGKHLIKYIKQLFNEEVVFKCYEENRELIDDCDVRGLNKCMGIIRGQLAKGDYSNEPFLTALEMMAADVEASRRLSRCVHGEMIIREAKVFDDWLVKQEEDFKTYLSNEKKQFDEGQLTRPRLYLETCKRFDSMIEYSRERIGLLHIKQSDHSVRVWDLQIWAAMVYRQGDAANLSLAIKLDGLELLSVPKFLNEQNVTNEQMWSSCKEHTALNSKDALAHLEALIEEIRREYNSRVRECYQKVKQNSDDKEQFNDIILVCQQLYQQLEFLKRLNNNMRRTSSVSDFLEQKVDPAGFGEKRKRQELAFTRLKTLYHENLGKLSTAPDPRALTDAQKLEKYLSRYKMFDERYKEGMISLGAEGITPDPYTRIMIEIRQILRTYFQNLQVHEIKAFLDFLDLKDKSHLTSGPTVHQLVEDVLNFLKSHSRYFPEAWVTKRERGYAIAVGALLQAMPDEIHEMAVARQAMEAVAVRIQEMSRDFSRTDWVNESFLEGLQDADREFQADIVLLRERLSELEGLKQQYLEVHGSNTLRSIQLFLVNILSRILEIRSLCEAQLFTDQEGLSGLFANRRRLREDKQNRDKEARRQAAAQQADVGDSLADVHAAAAAALATRSPSPAPARSAVDISPAAAAAAVGFLARRGPQGPAVPAVPAVSADDGDDDGNYLSFMTGGVK